MERKNFDANKANLPRKNRRGSDAATWPSLNSGHPLKCPYAKPGAPSCESSTPSGDVPEQPLKRMQESLSKTDPVMSHWKRPLRKRCGGVLALVPRQRGDFLKLGNFALREFLAYLMSQGVPQTLHRERAPQFRTNVYPIAYN